MTEIRIALIEADRGAGLGLSMFLGSLPQARVVFEESEPNKALERISDYLIDVVVVGLKQHGYSDAGYISELRNILNSAGTKARVIATVPFDSQEAQTMALVAGANSIYSFDTPMHKLEEMFSRKKVATELDSIDVLRKIAGLKQLKFDHRILEAAVRQFDEVETTVVSRFCEGLGDGDIAKELDISRTRVAKFLDSLVTGLDLGTRNQLFIALNEREL